MALRQATVNVIRWSGAQHPSITNVTHMMRKDGLRPYMWMNMPNHRYGIRSHGYNKVLYVIDGLVEITLPDSNQKFRLRAGDRVEIPAGVRHGTIVGNSGAKCVEAAKSGVRRRRRA